MSNEQKHQKHLYQIKPSLFTPESKALLGNLLDEKRPLQWWINNAPLIDRGSLTIVGKPSLPPANFVGHPTEQQAIERVKVLANYMEDMVGGTWETHVWHNGHWCYTVSNGSITLHEHIKGKKEADTYHCHIDTGMDIQGNLIKMAGTPAYLAPYVRTCNKPEDAYLSALEALVLIIEKHSKVLQANLKEIDCSNVGKLKLLLNG